MALAQTQLVLFDSSTPDDIFVCGHCKIVFNELHAFMGHKRTGCVREEPLDINRFDHPFVNVSVSTCEKNEIQIEVQSKPHCCRICNKSFRTLKYLQAHVRLHERPSQCPICGRCFQNNTHRKRHIETHKVWPDGLTETIPKSSDKDLLSYSCSYCEAVLSNFSQFRAHLTTHLSVKRFQCIHGECNKFFETVEDLLYHVTIDHEDIKYTCHLCKKEFLSLSEIAVHQQSYNECKKHAKQALMNQFKCSQCDATYRKPEKLSLHLLTENHNKSCVLCNKAFASDKRLRMHLLIHKNPKKYICDICNASFQLRKYLTSHMLKHSPKQFLCPICKQKFSRKDVLNRHMRNHINKKKMTCPFKDIRECTKEFNRADKLKQHLKSHTKKVKKKKSSEKTLEISILPFIKF